MTGYSLREGWYFRDGSSVNTDFILRKIDNANLMVVGPSGSGKTVNIMDKLMDYETIHDAKIVIFDCFGQYNLLHKLIEGYGKKSAFVDFDDDFVQSVSESIDTVFSGDKAGLLGAEKLPDILTVNLNPFLTPFGSSQIEDSMARMLLAAMDCMVDMVRKENSGRETIIVMDEAHHYLRAISNSNLMRVFSEKISDLNREGIWLWLATQNVIDMPVDASLFVNQFEFWEILAFDFCDITELAAISHLKNISHAQKAQIMDLEKKSCCYVEGILLNRTESECNKIYRYCPSSLAIVLCGTEAHEKAERLNLMEKEAVSELEAIQRLTHKLDVKRWGLAAPYLSPDRKPIIIDEPVQYVVKKPRSHN